MVLSFVLGDSWLNHGDDSYADPSFVGLHTCHEGPRIFFRVVHLNLRQNKKCQQRIVCFPLTVERFFMPS